MAHAQLKRSLGVFDALMMGLGSIVGTGVFVSIGIAAGITGPAVIFAIFLAALLATCNALSSAQLAASHPVSGGTYEYGYQYLHPTLGFSAGWMFLFAKSASAATAAIGFSGYLIQLMGIQNSNLLVPIAVGTSFVLSLIVLWGLKRTNITNIVIVLITFVSLILFSITGFLTMDYADNNHFTPFFTSENQSITSSFLYATAMMFVAYTGYGRIATLGEEVKEPQKTIPRAIVLTLGVTTLLYIVVATAAIGMAGATTLSEATLKSSAPLDMVASHFNHPFIRWCVSFGAMTAMLGVLLNLILGLSRVVLAMGRRGDFPRITAKINQAQTTPYVAVIVVSVVITSLACLGDVKTTWSFSAFTVLIYYAITNLAALRLPQKDRLYPRAFAISGLFFCLFLSFCIDWHVWSFGLGLLFIGLIWHMIAQKSKST